MQYIKLLKDIPCKKSQFVNASISKVVLPANILAVV